MSLEICCQCESPTGRAGRGDDSLYTDNDWGPYCPDCWGDADYWRCLTDEKVVEVERLRAALLPFCGPGGGEDMQAFCDLEEDIVVWKNSGKAVTAGDVRIARAAMGPVSMLHFRRGEPTG